MVRAKTPEYKDLTDFLNSYRGKPLLIRSNGNHFHTWVGCSFVQDPPNIYFSKNPNLDRYFLTELDKDFRDNLGKEYMVCPECFTKEFRSGNR